MDTITLDVAVNTLFFTLAQIINNVKARSNLLGKENGVLIAQ